ncbi:Haloalkane dehalogenase 2 [Koleobacter methoxysyntrophicus]|uniref:Haloalkane dehalogenase 2 n=1 Tax=Koleobacter methoxysyntrophicus TaxID=2751313 RepID=A0A8A0RQ91_9FIRM|nr:alpha/beta hydrolase [Koleobacter methoxysyntrophicus]QSQ09689.1 Haloalkane dehalogenase 2 [Koleobacter methoxysyntrophicus]
MPFFKFENFNIHYIDEGEGTPLVLLPGNTASSAVHKSELEYFGQTFRVICPDYIGYGKSDRVKDLSIEFWWKNAQMIVQLLQQLNIQNAYCVGTSGGAIIGLNMAIIAPSVVKGVIADSFMGEFFVYEEIVKIVQSRQEISTEQIAFWSYAHGNDWHYVIQKDSEMLIASAKSAKSVFKGRLNEIQCPVLILGSMKDDLIPDIVQKLSDVAIQIPSSKVILYPKGNHPVMWSRMKDFRVDVDTFLNSLQR